MKDALIKLVTNMCEHPFMFTLGVFAMILIGIAIF